MEAWTTVARTTGAEESAAISSSAKMGSAGAVVVGTRAIFLSPAEPSI